MTLAHLSTSLLQKVESFSGNIKASFSAKNSLFNYKINVACLFCFRSCGCCDISDAGLQSQPFCERPVQIPVSLYVYNFSSIHLVIINLVSLIQVGKYSSG